MSSVWDLETGAHHATLLDAIRGHIRDARERSHRPASMVYVSLDTWHVIRPFLDLSDGGAMTIDGIPAQVDPRLPRTSVSVVCSGGATP